METLEMELLFSEKSRKVFWLLFFKKVTPARRGHYYSTWHKRREKLTSRGFPPLNPTSFLKSLTKTFIVYYIGGLIWH